MGTLSSTIARRSKLHVATYRKATRPQTLSFKSFPLLLDKSRPCRLKLKSARIEPSRSLESEGSRIYA